jgi:hypothetical protein
LDELLWVEHLDAVSICTPARLHYGEAKQCLEAGLHVLCEKPLVLNSYAENRSATEELVELSEKKGNILTVNTQWPSVLDTIKDLVDLSDLKNFSMETQPLSTGVDMLTEQLSHTNSMLVKLIPGGRAQEISFARHSEKHIDAHFKYRTDHSECVVHYRFTHKAERPRKMSFSVNGTEFRREVGERYQQRLVTEKTTLDIEDPLKVSIGKFVGAIEGKDSPLISTKEIIENTALQDRLIAEYMKL